MQSPRRDGSALSHCNWSRPRPQSMPAESTRPIGRWAGPGRQAPPPPRPAGQWEKRNIILISIYLNCDKNQVRRRFRKEGKKRMLILGNSAEAKLPFCGEGRWDESALFLNGCLFLAKRFIFRGENRAVTPPTSALPSFAIIETI